MASQGTLFDLLVRFNSDADFREQFADPQNQDSLLDDYDLTSEQRDLIKFAVDDTHDYGERTEAVGRSLDLEYQKLPDYRSFAAIEGVVPC